MFLALAVWVLRRLCFALLGLCAVWAVRRSGRAPLAVLHLSGNP